MADNAVGAVLLGLAYFAVLMLVAVLDGPRPGRRRGRHRRDQPEGAR